MACILVIDDDSQLRSFLRFRLELAGYQVLEAGNGEQGLTVFDSHLPDLVLCDIIMEGKEGLETICELRRRFPDVKIIAMSGGFYGRRHNFLSLAEKLGAVRALEKPFLVGTLLSIANEVLQNIST